MEEVSLSQCARYSFQERIDVSPISVTDRLHKQLNVFLRAVWQKPAPHPPPAQAEAVLTLMSWGPVRDDEAGGWHCS